MNDTWTERSSSGFDRAQSHYDSMEPPEVRECVVCDGTGKVEVAIIFDVGGKHLTWPAERNLVEVECPFCVDGAPQPDWEKQRHDSLHER